MTRLFIVAALLTLRAFAQTACSIDNTTNCPCLAGQSPCVKTYLGQVKTSFNSIWAGIASTRQNRVPVGGVLIPASGAYGSGDLHSCFASNTCTFYDIGHIGTYIAQLIQTGASFITINIDPTPYIVASEYGGVCSVGGGSSLTYYTNVLQVLDAAVDTIHADGIPLKIAISPTGQTWVSCGLSATTMTEAQMQARLTPLYTAMVNHIYARGDTISHLVVGHEPTGYWTVATGGNTFSTSDWDIFINAACAAIPVEAPVVKCSSGYLTTETGYWTSAQADFATTVVLGLDIYPGSSATTYPTIIANATTMLTTAIGAGFTVGVNEAAPVRDVDGTCSGGGEVCTYYGCGWSGWDTYGLTTAWTAVFVSAMEAAKASYITVFPTGPFFGTTSRGNLASGASGTNCNDNNPTTSYYAGVLSGGAITAAGNTFNLMSDGGTVAMQGNVKIDGNVKMPVAPNPSPNCLISGSTCVNLTIVGETFAPGTFSGAADPSMFKDPNTSTIWMAYSWPNSVGGNAAIETHVAKSTNNGVTWTLVGTLFPSGSMTYHSATARLSNEVIDIFPYNVAGVTHWAAIHRSYWQSGGSDITASSRFEYATAASDAATGPMALAGVTPQYIGTNGNTDLITWPLDLNMQATYPSMSTCSSLREAAVWYDITAGKGMLFMGCGNFSFYAQFSTPDLSTALPTWTRLSDGNSFGTVTDAADLCTYTNCTSPAGTRYLTEIDIMKNTGGTKTLGLVSIIYLAPGRVSTGYVLAELDTSTLPYKWLKNGLGKIVVDNTVTSADSLSGGPGSGTYEAASTGTGAIIAHKMTNCHGGTPGCNPLNAINNVIYSYLQSTLVLP